MKCNLSFFDRLVRFALGAALLSWAFVGGPLWAYFGLYLLFSSGWGFCVIYAFFKVRTLPEFDQDGPLLSRPPSDLP